MVGNERPGVDIMSLDADYIYILDNFDGVVDEYAEEFDEFITLDKFNEISNEITCELQGWQPEIDYTEFVRWLYNDGICRIKRWNP